MTAPEGLIEGVKVNSEKCECVNVLMCKSLTNELTHLRINEFNSQLSMTDLG